MANVFTKDPDEVLDYKFDWSPLTNGSGKSNWLQVGEVISTKTVTITPTVATVGLAADSSSITDTSTSVTVWLSKGVDNADYKVTCKIVTNAPRTKKRTMTICVRNDDG